VLSHRIRLVSPALAPHVEHLWMVRGYLPTHWLFAQPLIITVIGKAFFDISYAPAALEPENRSSRLRGMGDSSGDETGDSVII